MTTSIFIRTAGFASLFFTMFLLVNCGGGEAEKNGDEIVIDDDYYEFQDFIMKKYDIDAVISLPDETANIGASTRPEVIHQESFKWEINVGPKFHLNIEDFGNYNDLVIEKKKELADQKFFKINYLIDDKDMIVYERTLVVGGSEKASSRVGVEHKSYHVYGQKTVDKVIYALSTSDEGCEKHIVELMAKSIKSFKPFKTKN